MTSPADLPPPDPERGNPAKLRWAAGYFVAFLVCIFVAAIMASRDYWVAMACAFAVAAVFLVASVAVLAGRKQP